MNKENTNAPGPAAYPQTDGVPAKKRGDFRLLRILTAVIYAAVTAFMVYQLADCIVKLGKHDQTAGLNLVLFLLVFVLIWGTIVYAVPTVMAIVGAVLTKKRRKARGERGAPVYFIVMSVLPYATELLVIFVCYLLPKIFP